MLVSLEHHFGSTYDAPGAANPLLSGMTLLLGLAAHVGNRAWRLASGRGVASGTWTSTKRAAGGERDAPSRRNLPCHHGNDLGLTPTPLAKAAAVWPLAVQLATAARHHSRE